MSDPQSRADREQLVLALRGLDQVTARVHFERRQELRLPGRQKPSQSRLLSFSGPVRAGVARILRTAAEPVIANWSHLNGTGVIDFPRRRCLLRFPGPDIMLEQATGYIGEAGKWCEEDKQVAEFMSLGGPFWLVDVLRGIRSATALPWDCARPDLRRFEVLADLAHASTALGAPVRSLRPEQRVLSLEVDIEKEWIVRIAHSSAVIAGASVIELSEFDLVSVPER